MLFLRTLKFSITGATWWPDQFSVRLDFSSGRGRALHEFQPPVRLCADSAEPACDFLSLPLSLRSKISITVFFMDEKKM